MKFWLFFPDRQNINFPYFRSYLKSLSSHHEVRPKSSFSLLQIHPFCFRLEICNYSGYKIYPGHGIRSVKTDGKVCSIDLPFEKDRRAFFRCIFIWTPNVNYRLICAEIHVAWPGPFIIVENIRKELRNRKWRNVRVVILNFSERSLAWPGTRY